jgi:hypothetical protein
MLNLHALVVSGSREIHGTRTTYSGPIWSLDNRKVLLDTEFVEESCRHFFLNNEHIHALCTICPAHELHPISL